MPADFSWNVRRALVLALSVDVTFLLERTLSDVTAPTLPILLPVIVVFSLGSFLGLFLGYPMSRGGKAFTTTPITNAFRHRYDDFIEMFNRARGRLPADASTPDLIKTIALRYFVFSVVMVMPATVISVISEGMPHVVSQDNAIVQAIAVVVGLGVWLVALGMSLGDVGAQKNLHFKPLVGVALFVFSGAMLLIAAMFATIYLCGALLMLIVGGSVYLGVRVGVHVAKQSASVLEELGSILDRLQKSIQPLTGFLLGYVATMVVFAGYYLALYHIDPLRTDPQHAIFTCSNPPCAKPLTFAFEDFLYLSMNTIYPLGYSPIHPNAGLTQMLTFIEAMLGIGWTVVILGMLIQKVTETKGKAMKIHVPNALAQPVMPIVSALADQDHRTLEALLTEMQALRADIRHGPR